MKINERETEFEYSVKFLHQLMKYKYLNVMKMNPCERQNLLYTVPAHVELFECYR